jgi:GT2 family glycosyltransferase
MKAEILVVDNLSSDDSIFYLRPLFPSISFIENPKNMGFSAANNLAVQHCSGEFILFLNPDTLIPEDCLSNCLQFLRAHPKAGALGIRMLDGSGVFLPESKRAFPSPIRAFYKLLGFSAMFPRSHIFNRYSLGNLNSLENHEVDVLAGAFMMVSKPVLDLTGGFDERFFMYGEDIDLSYRIQKAGFTNYYYAGSSIIHFKGESTRKGSMNYVKLFYTAMLLFVQKNYRGTKAGFFGFFIQAAIILRGLFSAFHKIGIYPFKNWAKKQIFVKNRAESIVILTKFAENHPKLGKNTTLIFCESEQFSWKQIIQKVEELSPTGAQFRFRACNSHSIVGSDSKETEGEALAANIIS